MLAAALLSASLAGGAQAVPTGKFIPEAEDFRSQDISRTTGEADWPFTAERGVLLCAPSLKDRLVYFVPENAKGEQEFPFALDANMMTVAVVNMGRASVLRPFDSFEQLLKRLSPYIAMGKRLCDQPAGTKLQDGAL